MITSEQPAAYTYSEKQKCAPLSLSGAHRFRLTNHHFDSPAAADSQSWHPPSYRIVTMIALVGFKTPGAVSTTACSVKVASMFKAGTK